jgi:hypothetical protein
MPLKARLTLGARALAKVLSRKLASVLTGIVTEVGECIVDVTTSLGPA